MAKIAHDKIGGTWDVERYRAMQTALSFPANGTLAKNALHLGTIPLWNDDPNRTWDEVKERVKDAIGKL